MRYLGAIDADMRIQHDETEHLQHGRASRLHLWRTVTAIRHIGSTSRARPPNGRATARHSHGVSEPIWTSRNAPTDENVQCIGNELVRPCSLCEDIATVEQDCRTTYQVCTAEEAIRRSYPGAEIY